MSEPKTWSREELIAILGQPDSEKTQTTMLGYPDQLVEIEAIAVAAPTDAT